MDRNQFLEWIKDWHKRYGGYIPSEVDKWFDSVIVKHQDLAPFLNGRLTQKVLVKVYEKNQLTLPEYRSVVNFINKAMPHYWGNSEISQHALGFPYIKTGKYAGMAVTKHIAGYWERHGNRNPVYHIELVKLLSELGEKYRILLSAEPNKEYIFFSIHPLTFCRIGQMTGAYSCFSQGLFNDDKKFAFADMKNTAVCVKTDKDLSIDEFETLMASSGITGVSMRCLTVVSFKHKFVCGANFSCRSYNSDIQPYMMSTLFKHFFNKEPDRCDYTSPLFQGGINYCGNMMSAYDGDSNTMKFVFPIKYSKEKNGDKRDQYCDTTKKETNEDRY